MSCLQSVRTKGDWESWIEFFLEGVTETSEQGVTTARRLLELFRATREKIADMGERRHRHCACTQNSSDRLC